MSRMISTYKVKVRLTDGVIAKAFKDTTEWYRKAVDFFVSVALSEWSSFESLPSSDAYAATTVMERMTNPTKSHPVVKYPFSEGFYKFPHYYRRAAILEAVGKVKSYKSNYALWESGGKNGKKPGRPRSGNAYPALYRENTFVRLDSSTVRIKVYIRNTWDWLTVKLNQQDVNYIARHCSHRKEMVPTLIRTGKQWFLTFPYAQNISFKTVDPSKERILAVDLGINNACVCCVMTSNGTVLSRHFNCFDREEDYLKHDIGRIKKAQQHGSSKAPRLWAYAVNDSRRIAERTAEFLARVLKETDADTVVFEALDLKGKIKGSRGTKMRLNLWTANRIQAIVEHRAHAMGKRVSHVNAKNTSALAFDGSGKVIRSKDNYSICTFASGKKYNCDLSASYNIGARYFIRKIQRMIPETDWLDMTAKVPSCSRRSTCTLSTLLALCGSGNAVSLC